MLAEAAGQGIEGALSGGRQGASIQQLQGVHHDYISSVDDRIHIKFIN
jgi:hypothetical protein